MISRNDIYGGLNQNLPIPQNNQINQNNYKEEQPFSCKAGIYDLINENNFQNYSVPTIKKHMPYSFLNDKQILKNGTGINKDEQEKIISLATKCYEESNNSQQTISQKLGNEIKNNLGGKWLVFVCDKSNKYDFKVSILSENDYFSFLIGNSMFFIGKLNRKKE